MYYVTRQDPGRNPRTAKTEVWECAVSIAYTMVTTDLPAWAKDENGDCAITPVWFDFPFQFVPGGPGYEIRDNGDGDKHVAAVIT